MKAFITGSHAYGTPRQDSDVDLVLRVDQETREQLVKLLVESGELDSTNYGVGTLQFKVGKLNLILCLDDARYGAWRTGTEQLKARKPVTRNEAVALFKSLLRNGEGAQAIAELQP